MKKKLNIDSIANELEGASLFFKRQSSPPPQDTSITETGSNPNPSPSFEEKPPIQTVEPTKIDKPKKHIEKIHNDTVVPRHHDTMTPSNHDTMQSFINEAIVGLVRKAVKEFGKEAATHRFTEIEKKEIADLIYTYKNRGIKTSENEITRIAVNYIIEDYKENGENSVLHKILKALNE